MIMSDINQNRIVVLDVETTGLWPRRGDRIIEIGAIAIENRIMMEEFNTLIDTTRSISREAQQVHGITREMLEGKPKSEVVMPEFQEFIRDSILVAHNAKFDMGFIRHEFQRQKLSFNHYYICTLEMSQARCPHLPNHKLSTVYRHLIEKNGDVMPTGACSGNPWIDKIIKTPLVNPSLSKAAHVPESPSIPLPPGEGRVRANGAHFTKQMHRALADARMAAAIWLAMEER
jgi:DNA polymerase III subunit epsilon